LDYRILRGIFETENSNLESLSIEVNKEFNSLQIQMFDGEVHDKTYYADTPRDSEIEVRKVKKYKISLKTVKSKVDGKTYLKAGKKLTLKIKGKTFTAKTNKKGVATFKIKKLTKKGKYTATIKFKGDNTYKASTKKVKITIK
jgi:hypothetical protein